MASLASLLKSWNLTDKDDQDIPVSEAKTVFEKIPSSDIKYILKAIEQAKKDSIGATGKMGLEQ
jgi:hypothetical protein